MKSWTFVLFYLFLYKKFTLKLKVKNKTSKKFKKGINVQLCSNLKVCVHNITMSKYSAG